MTTCLRYQAAYTKLMLQSFHIGHVKPTSSSASVLQCALPLLLLRPCPALLRPCPAAALPCCLPILPSVMFPLSTSSELCTCAAAAAAAPPTAHLRV